METLTEELGSSDELPATVEVTEADTDTVTSCVPAMEPKGESEGAAETTGEGDAASDADGSGDSDGSLDAEGDADCDTAGVYE